MSMVWVWDRAQALDLLDSLNQNPVCQEMAPEPRAVDTCHIDSNSKLTQRDTLVHSRPIHRMGGIE